MKFLNSVFLVSIYKCLKSDGLDIIISFRMFLLMMISNCSWVRGLFSKLHAIKKYVLNKFIYHNFNI